MVPERTPDPAETSPGYEERDVQPRAIVWLFGGIGAMVIVAASALWLTWKGLERAAAKQDPVLSPLAEHVSPPPPQLQSAPAADYQEHLANEERSLSTYGWVDRQRGVVRVPIDRAIELLIERGEPAMPPPLANPSAPAR